MSWGQLWISFLFCSAKKWEGGINLHHLDLRQAVEGASVHFLTHILFNFSQFLSLFCTFFQLTGFAVGRGRWRCSAPRKRDGCSRDSWENIVTKHCNRILWPNVRTKHFDQNIVNKYFVQILWWNTASKKCAKYLDQDSNTVCNCLFCNIDQSVPSLSRSHWYHLIWFVGLLSDCYIWFVTQFRAIIMSWNMIGWLALKSIWQTAAAAELQISTLIGIKFGGEVCNRLSLPKHSCRLIWMPDLPILGPFFHEIANKVENSLKIWAHKLHRREIYADANIDFLSLSWFCHFVMKGGRYLQILELVCALKLENYEPPRLQTVKPHRKIEIFMEYQNRHQYHHHYYHHPRHSRSWW